jgi:protoporphyrinogen oxidase
MEIVIIGSGIAGLSASYILKQNGIGSQIIESRNSYGGLLDSIHFNGFRFDRAIHLSFADQPEVRAIFDQTPYIAHKPESKNFDREYWLKHPVQNNLEPLPVEEKIELIKGFIERPEVEVNNYKDWLIYQYGKPFAEKYPLKYTLKYWTVDANELGLDWIGSRMYRVSIDEVLRGAMTANTENVYYAKEMRYPLKGGYKAFLTPLVEEATIEYNSEVTSINLQAKQLTINGKQIINFSSLINTMPLPMLIERIHNVPDNVKTAAKKLWATSLDLISVGFNKAAIPKDLWFYIYDEDILASRVYSPSIKSLENCPEGKSSVQFEIYSSSNKPMNYSKDELKQNCIYALKKMGLANEEDIEFLKHDKIEYGNVVFYNDMEQDREIITDWLTEQGIYLAGRFGEWDYFWSHQAMESGFKAAEKLLNK